MSDVAVADFLDSLGLAPAEAQRARALLEANGITNPRKSRISEAKLDRAREAIDARFARFCASCAERMGAAGVRSSPSRRLRARAAGARGKAAR